MWTVNSEHCTLNNPCINPKSCSHQDTIGRWNENKKTKKMEKRCTNWRNFISRISRLRLGLCSRRQFITLLNSNNYNNFVSLLSSRHCTCQRTAERDGNTVYLYRKAGDRVQDKFPLRSNATWLYFTCIPCLGIRCWCCYSVFSLQFFKYK